MAQGDRERVVCRDCDNEDCRCEDWIAEDDEFMRAPTTDDFEAIRDYCNKWAIFKRGSGHPLTLWCDTQDEAWASAAKRLEGK